MRPGARQFFMDAKATSRAPQEFTGTRVLAKLGHGNAAQGQRRRVVAQGDALKRAKRVAGDKGACCSGDH